MSHYITGKKNEYNFELRQSLNNPIVSRYKYWAIFKIFYSGKKIPLIPPLVINNQLVTDFWEKASFSNFWFAKQYIHIKNNSSIGELQCDFDHVIKLSMSMCVGKKQRCNTNLLQGALHIIQIHFEINSSFIFEKELSAISTNITTYHSLAVLLVTQIGKRKVQNYHFTQYVYLLRVVPLRNKGGQTN